MTYTKNYNLGLEVPYRHESESRRYLPDFIVRVDDGHGSDDLLNLVVEVKGYRREDAKMKKLTMNSYWIPGVNQLKTYGRWAFAEFDDVYAMAADFKTKLEAQFNQTISAAVTAQGGV
jgi:type III restriction enzyme